MATLEMSEVPVTAPVGPDSADTITSLSLQQRLESVVYKSIPFGPWIAF